MRIRSLPLWVLLLTSCEKPPPPPPPPTPAQRLDKGVEKLRKLAEDELKANPKDPHLQLWVAAFQGRGAPEPNSVVAITRASAAPEDAAALKAVEETLPGSSIASLCRARWILRHARETPDYWKTATEAVEEALKRNQWDCPIAAFDRWALAWLERNEPDALVRACYRHGYVNTARHAASDLQVVADGMAAAAGTPRLDAPRVARAVRRLIEERLLKSPAAADVIFAHDAHPAALEAQFLLAWRAKDLETARAASLAFEDYGKRDAALKAWLPTHRSRLDLDSTILALLQDGALKAPFAAGMPPASRGADEDAKAWRKESLKEVDAGAKAFFAARKADATRTSPLAAEFDAKRPAQSPKRNYLGHALRDREFLFTDAWPKDRHEQLLEAAFGDDLNDGQVLGLKTYGWVIRESLVRPATIPSKDLARRFSKDKDAPRPGKDMDLFALLRARKEAVADDRRPSPADVRKQGTSTSGYALLLWAAVKAKPAEAVEWLPVPDVPLPSTFEVLVAETLRAATEKDFGLDWARWKDFLETGQ